MIAGNSCDASLPLLPWGELQSRTRIPFSARAAPMAGMRAGEATQLQAGDGFQSAARGTLESGVWTHCWVLLVSTQGGSRLLFLL
jgi:hypothetical protein